MQDHQGNVNLPEPTLINSNPGLVWFINKFYYPHVILYTVLFTFYFLFCEL